MSFLGGLGKIAKGAVGGFLMGGPMGALAGGAAGAFSGGGGGSGALGDAAAQQGRYATEDRNRFLGALGGAQDAVNTSTRAAVEGALPSFMKNLQGSREDAIRRGASNGDLQTSYEGDLSSAFQRNVSNAAAGQATNVLGQQLSGYGNLANGSQNNYLDLLSGSEDRKQQDSNNKFGLLGSVVGAAGSAAGAYYGGRH